MALHKRELHYANGQGGQAIKILECQFSVLFIGTRYLKIINTNTNYWN